MKKNLKKLLISIVLVLFALGSGGAAPPDAEHKPLNMRGNLSKDDENRQNKDENDAFIVLLSDINAAMEIAGVRGGEYSAKIARELQFDALRLGAWFAHFGIREESFFDPSPSQFNNQLQYIALGYELANARISAFWDHTCINPSRKVPEGKRSGIHWNELGIGYKTTGMMVGHKNDGIKFNSASEWLNKINWQASASKIWMRTENDYEWMVKVAGRDDVYRANNHVFYIHFSLNSIYDNRGVNFNPCLEIGDRIKINESVYVIPFMSYAHFHDWYSEGYGDWYSIGPGEDFFSLGVSLEIGLDRVNSKQNSTQAKQKISWSPKLSITGSYTSIIDNDDYGHSSDLTFDLELLKLSADKTLYLNTYAGILTLPDDLNPYIVQYSIGPSVEIDLNNWALKILHSYACLYGIEHPGVIRDYNLFGLELNNNHVSPWSLSAGTGVYASKTNFDYRGNLHGNLGYNFFLKGIYPYLKCSGNYLQGNNSVFGHAIETGIQIPGKTGSFSIYLRFQDDFDVFRFGKGRQKLFGIRVNF